MMYNMSMLRHWFSNERWERPEPPSVSCSVKVCIYCVLCVCIGLLSAEFSTVNTGLGRPMFSKPLCLLITPEGLAATNYQLT